MVADAKMVEYHGQPHVESYVLTIMNMVGLLWAGPVRGGPGVALARAEVGAGQRAGRPPPGPQQEEQSPSS